MSKNNNNNKNNSVDIQRGGLVTNAHTSCSYESQRLSEIEDMFSYTVDGLLYLNLP